ncbi:ubiquinol oxidase subunit II [Commensalibacter oyaizuii]|uniref:Ubiquinol oxidase subunit 2 n=1 Tax=Commensalibacter oyaizuii TaxID=3043873 RepID=A0ABT6PYU9_9PROT|nr:ubiquinol oxidase subunit II [Commensalibacter sp. TBRC 16381]MDI2090034.1 ubiquinol oxidase subunit II [Commensalibacter sp. TBRC 16381]
MKKNLPKLTLSVAGLTSILMLGGCNLAIMDPKGTIGEAEKHLILMCAGAMLCIVIPVIIATLIVARRYRKSNTSATYAPKWAHSNTIEFFVWSIPICLIAFLAYKTYISSHELDPYQPIKAPAVNPQAKALNIQVVALNWKWLFIYPDYGIAAVNEMAMPVNTPVAFRLTSDATMNSFWIPQLGSQVYVMAGMQTQLHLMATSNGDFAGVSNNYSGAGYSDMKFRALSKDEKGFKDWVEKVKASSQQLDDETYAKLHVDSIKDPVQYYGHVEPALFDHIVAKYNDGNFNVQGHGSHHVGSAQSDNMHAGE